ncbi:MAG: efflux RND transporter permease subunit [Proteobacteria bacterium]|nr:efflux RND transporter permease subunit [Pseudomonadota bacterium]
MKITDIFVRRPVLATVISLLILVLGIRSVGLLPIRQFPFTENAIITVTTYYIGADPEIMAGFITTPLETSIAQANGIDYMTSISTQNTSIITVNLLLNYDSNAALSDINSKVNAVINQLPPASQQPTLGISISETVDSMYIAFYSGELANNQITDYLVRVVQPRLQAVNGVQKAEILGQQLIAMRIWLNPLKMSALGVTAADIAKVLAANDFISASGRTDGNMITINLTATTGLHTVKQFENLIVKANNSNAIVRIKDVATVTLGAQNYNSSVSFDNKDAVYIGIQVAPKANLLTVMKNIRQIYPSILAQLPQGLRSNIVYDATEYVHASIEEVIKSIIEALIIVTVVIFLFLGSVRSVIIPSVTIPLSLIGAFFVMFMFHYSINLLTLLALVLAIGLVVDDAIIVVENVERHIEQGLKPIDAAIIGARELANPILAITVILIAVYLPIGFMGGLTGALFTEFAFTLAGAVTISAIIALTLSPMMSSKMLKPKINDHKNRFMLFLDNTFDHLRKGYTRRLHRSLDYLPVTLVFASLILISIYFLYATSKKELAPMEDQGVIITQMTTAPNASLSQTILYSKPMAKNFLAWPEVAHTFEIFGNNGFNSSIVGGVLKTWDQRRKTEMSMVPYAQQQLNEISGVKGAAFELPPLPGGGQGLPVQFVIQSANPFLAINDVALSIIQEAYKTGQFLYLDSDLKIDKQQVTIDLDRDKISQMGLTMQDVGDVLTSSLSENYINYFSLDGRSYQVIPQTSRMDRLNFQQLLNYYIRTSSGSMVPLSTVVKFHSSVVPETINHFQQLNSATISAVMAPGVTQAQALQTLNQIATRIITPDYFVNYASQSRQYIQESSALIVTFFFALIVIYLALAALFESFRDPLIILISVPMSICGAMIFISLGIGGASLNIYSEVGLVTLIGLISKHGILIVQFANDTQLAGKSKREAIEIAAGIRLRPILMTTAAMVLGVIPLILATGAGAVSRYNIGLVIATGIAIGTLFTLFVVPAMYMLLAEELKPREQDQSQTLQLIT